MKTTDTVTYDASSAIVLATQAQQQLANAADFVIDSHMMFELASDDLKKVKALQKEVEGQRTGIVGPLNQAVKAVNDAGLFAFVATQPGNSPCLAHGTCSLASRR